MPRKISQYLEKRNIPPKQTQEAFLQPEEEEKNGASMQYVDEDTGGGGKIPTKVFHFILTSD